MDRNEYRDEDDDVNAAPDTYWRRRAVTLALGLGLLGMLAWGFSGGGGKSQATSSNLVPAAALGTAVPGAPGAASPGGPGGSAPTPTGPSTGSSQSGSADPLKAATPGSTTPASPGRDRRDQSPSPSPGGTASAGCAPGSVVLSLFTDRTSYGAQQFPRFSVYAVSTSGDSCTFNPSQVQVVVLSADRVIWSSTDCARAVGHAGRAAVLARGVPVQDEEIWNRAITLPGCQILASSAHDGSYAVQARTATVQSPIRYFKLTG